MITRREWVRMTVGAGAAMVLAPELLRALGRQEIIRRAIPSTGEMVPAVGLSFSNHPSCADHAALKEVLKAFADNGGTFYDALHGNAANEEFHATAAKELGIKDKLFWSTRATPAGVPPQPSAAFVNGHIDTLLARLQLPRLDLAMLPATADPSQIAALIEAKRAGRVRYIGFQTIVDTGYAQIESLMRNEPIDFIGVDYDVGNRAGVEDRILPLAQERKVGVMAFFPFGNNGGFSCVGSGSNLFARVGNRPLPDWAADFDAKSWAHFFLKYVLGHPAITVARVGTTKVAHMLDNMGGGIGRLPDEATRKRMAEFIDALPPAPPPAPPTQEQPPVPPGPTVALSAAVLERYVGEYSAASGFTAIFRREGTTLHVKPGNNPEAALIARTETRFQDPRGPYFEFQLDAQGRVTGAVLEQGAQRVVLQRKYGSGVTAGTLGVGADPNQRIRPVQDSQRGVQPPARTPLRLTGSLVSPNLVRQKDRCSCH